MITLSYGREQVRVEIAPDVLVPVRRCPPVPPLADVPATVRAALEAPLGFPPLRRALTPDDHVVVVFDEGLPRLPELLSPILEHLGRAQIAPPAVTLLTAPTRSGQRWVDDLPEAFEDVVVEVHDPGDRKKLSYLATTRGGRRIYVNRTLVDADQVVVLCRPDADPLLAPGGVGLLYPALGDEAARRDRAAQLSAADRAAQGLLAEEAEVAWLLGAPFLVQVIEGAGDDVAGVVAGPVETGDEGVRLYGQRWQQTVPRLADTVVATVSGDAARHDFASLARALAHAARVVEPDGHIILLTQAEPRLGPGADVLRRAGEPDLALDLLRRQQPEDVAAAVQWVAAVRRAQIYLLSRLPGDVAEELFVTPLEHAGQVQRLFQNPGTCLILEDADRALPSLADEDADA